MRLILGDVHQPFAGAVGINIVATPFRPIAEFPVKFQRMRNTIIGKVELGDGYFDVTFAALAIDVLNPFFALRPPAQRKLHLVGTIAGIAIVINSAQTIFFRLTAKY